MKRLALIVLPLLLVALALAERGGRSALALPQDVKILSVSCASNPEVTVIQNMGLLPVSLNGFALNDLAPGAPGAAAASSSVFYPLPPGLALNPGQTITFFSGPAAAPISSSFFTLTRVYIYNHALAQSRTEGAVLSFNGQAVSTVICSEAATPFPTPATPAPATASPSVATALATPTPFTPTATATPANATVTATVFPTASSTASVTSGGATSASATPSTAAGAGATVTPVPTATPAVSATPSATPVIASATGPTTVSYAPGWNLVGGPDGTVFSGAQELLAPSADGSAYVTLDPQQPATAGIGYWAYFPAGNSDPSVMLAPSTLQTLMLDVQTGVWSLVGNPTEDTVLVSGADAVETYSPSSGYQSATDLAPGQGALVFSYTNAQITLIAEPAGAASGAPQVLTNAAAGSTPTATNPATPAPTATPQQEIPTAHPPQ